MKRLCLSLALIAGIAGFMFSSPTSAQIMVRIGPPAPRYERVPPARRGYAWRAGYWNWQGGRYVWVGGMWVSGHRGNCWVPAHWARGYFSPGHWRC
jgi:hypothetical protein